MNLKPINGFCGGSYLARGRGAAAMRTVNYRVEKNEDPASLTPLSMYARPGKKLFATAPASPHFGMWANKSRVFYAAGGNIYELKQDKTSTLIGAVTVGSNPVTMRANGTQLLVCSGGAVYIATGTAFYQPIVNYASGLVSIAGNVATWISGDKFTDVSAGDYFMVDSTLCVVAVVTDDEHVTLDTAPGDTAQVSYQAGTELLTGATCEFIDGYFIVGVPNTKKFRISNLLDGRKWDEIDTAEKSGSTDNIATILNVSGQLVLFGDTNSIEVWTDSGDADFPFVRVSGRTLDVGADAPWSVAKLVDGSVCWLLNSDPGNAQIVRSGGGIPQRISNYALEFAMRSYARLDDAIASTYLMDGHSFYRIDFPTANRTWEYDQTLNLWTEVGIASLDDEVFLADLGRYHCHVTWPNETRMHLVGDYTSGKIWEVSSEFEDDDGVDFPTLRVGPNIGNNFERVKCPAFALLSEFGSIDPTAVGADGKALIAMVSMAYSNDGSKTWSDAMAASLGRAGEYEGTFLTSAESFDATVGSQTNPQAFEPRPIWKQLGSSWISKTFKVKSNGRILRAIHGALTEFTK